MIGFSQKSTKSRFSQARNQVELADVETLGTDNTARTTLHEKNVIKKMNNSDDER